MKRRPKEAAHSAAPSNWVLVSQTQQLLATFEFPRDRLQAARLLKIDDRLGTIEANKLADVVAVRGNPLEDIHHLRTLELVFKAGHLVSDSRKEGV